jgi:hypothetical protein
MTATDDGNATGLHSSHNGHRQYSAMLPWRAPKVDLSTLSISGRLNVRSRQPEAIEVMAQAARLN